MPVELQIIRASEFVRMGGEGKFDLPASCAVLAHLAQACKRRGVQRALLDARRARAELSPAELASLVNVLHEFGFAKCQRLAILHSGDRYHRARLFAFISRMKGWNVRAFGNFEDALCWLSVYEDKPRPKASATSKPVYVTHVDDETRTVAIKSHPNRKKHGGAKASLMTEARVMRGPDLKKPGSVFGRSGRSRVPRCRVGR